MATTKKQPEITKENIAEFDFESLDFETLTGINGSVNGILANRKEAAKAAFVQETIDKAAALGLDLDLSSLQGSVKKTKSGRAPIGPVKPKYTINGEVWSGRGRTPLKIASAIEELGITVQQFKEDSQYRINQED